MIMFIQFLNSAFNRIVPISNSLGYILADCKVFQPSNSSLQILWLCQDGKLKSKIWNKQVSEIMCYHKTKLYNKACSRYCEVDDSQLRCCWRRSHVIGRKMWGADICGRLYIALLHITLNSIFCKHIIFGYLVIVFYAICKNQISIKMFPISIFALIARISPCFNLVATQHLRHFEFSWNSSNV